MRDALEVPVSAFQTDDGPLRIGFLGRLHPKKNLDVLIRAVRRASNDARLLVAGEGPSGYTANLKGLVAELEMEDRIEWLGFTEGSSKWHFIDQIDVLAMPSQYECFGMAAAEAIARGTPIIVSQHTGMAELYQTV
jgi:glycosyltransferase involved in cell wall biosynthesis